MKLGVSLLWLIFQNRWNVSSTERCKILYWYWLQSACYYIKLSPKTRYKVNLLPFWQIWKSQNAFWTDSSIFMHSCKKVLGFLVTFVSLPWKICYYLILLKKNIWSISGWFFRKVEKQERYQNVLSLKKMFIIWEFNIRWGNVPFEKVSLLLQLASPTDVTQMKHIMDWASCYR